MATTAAVENDLDLFARVENGEIIEFPVYRLYIVNRAHPLSWYTQVTETAKPELPPFNYHKRTVKVVGAEVVATYEAVPYTLNEILSQLRRNTSAMPGIDEPDINIADVDPATIKQVYVLGGDYLDEKLDAFAQTRLYTSIGSLVGFANSTFTKFNVEGNRGLVLRDTCWKNLVTYFDEVIAGVLPIPKSTDVIDALLPELTWEDAVVPPFTAAVTPETTDAV